jgi:hypothetical protein
MIVFLIRKSAVLTSFSLKIQFILELTQMFDLKSIYDLITIKLTNNYVKSTVNFFFVGSFYISLMTSTPLVKFYFFDLIHIFM